MTVWPCVGVNYKSRNVSNIAADISYFKSIGLDNIRAHLPSVNAFWDAGSPVWTPTVHGNNNWRTLAKQFHDEGFYTVWGLTANNGHVMSNSWENYRNCILAEAAYCEANDVVNEFQIGNELEHTGLRLATLIRSGSTVTATTVVPHGFTNSQSLYVKNCIPTAYNGTYTITVTGTYTFTYEIETTPGAVTSLGIVTDLSTVELNSLCMELATDVKSVFSGIVSYTFACFGSYPGNWINSGKGNLDLLGANVYGNYGISSGSYNPSNYRTNIPLLQDAFGDEWYISEFNVEATTANFNAMPEARKEEELEAMHRFIRESGVSKAFLYQYRAFQDGDSNDSFFLRYNNGRFRRAWNAIATNNGRRIYLDNGDTVI